MRLILAIQQFLQQSSQSFETLIRVWLLSKWFVKKPQQAQDSTLVILGNGPSLEETLTAYPNVISGKALLAVNHFASTDLYIELKPKYYIFSAPDLWLDDIDSHFVEQSKVLFDNLAGKTNWGIDLFVPFEARKHARWRGQLKSNSHIKITYYNNVPCEGWRWWSHYTFRRMLGMPRPHNVMIPSMMMGLAMGFRKIYLLGADHSWLSQISVDDQNRALVNQKHFYDKDDSTSKPLDNRGKGARRLHEILHKFMLAFKGYFILNEYAKSQKVQILNATPGSFIDAFDRIAPENIE